jgi:hypothetical protein
MAAMPREQAKDSCRLPEQGMYGAPEWASVVVRAGDQGAVQADPRGPPGPDGGEP